MTEFGSINLEDMAGEGQRLEGGSEGGKGNFLDQFVPMPEVKPGQTAAVTVRILPPVKGGKLFQYNRTHTINGRSVHCPRPLVNGKWDYKVPCAICEYVSSLWKQIEKLEKQHGKDCPEADPIKAEARDIKAVERYYYNAIVRSLVIDGKEQKNVGPRILSVGVKLHKTFVRAIMGVPGDPESKLGNIADLKAGWDFIIRKTIIAGGDGFPNYDASGFSRNQSIAGTAEEISVWATNLHDLTKLRNPREADYIEKELAIHRGLVADESEGFNVENFDAKWGGKGAAQVENVAKKAQASVPATVVKDEAPATSEPANEAPAEDLAIEDEAFLKELEGMEG